MRSVDILSERVHRSGGKVTAQRLAIWRALEGDETHPTAEQLYARLKPEMPSLSLATLYHVLNELVEWGEMRRFDAGDGHIHFDPDMTPHAELICMRCHAVVDVPDELESQPRPVPAELAGYRIVSRSEQYIGYCPSCRQALDARTSREAQDMRET